MKTFWSYVSTFLSGAITMLLLYLKIKDPDQVINENNKIGKVKQYGTGNDADLSNGNDLSSVGATLCGRPTRKEIRQARRAERKLRRGERKEEREKRKYLEE